MLPITDLLLTLSPLTFALRLHRPLSERLIVALLVALGLAATAADLVRLAFLIRTPHAQLEDLTFAVIPLYIATSAQAWIGVMAACTSTLHGLTERALRLAGVQASNSGTGGGARGGGAGGGGADQNARRNRKWKWGTQQQREMRFTRDLGLDALPDNPRMSYGARAWRKMSGRSGGGGKSGGKSGAGSVSEPEPMPPMPLPFKSASLALERDWRAASVPMDVRRSGPTSSLAAVVASDVTEPAASKRDSGLSGGTKASGKKLSRGSSSKSKRTQHLSSPWSTTSKASMNKASMESPGGTRLPSVSGSAGSRSSPPTREGSASHMSEEVSLAAFLNADRSPSSLAEARRGLSSYRYQPGGAMELRITNPSGSVSSSVVSRSSSTAGPSSSSVYSPVGTGPDMLCSPSEAENPGLSATYETDREE
jgi:hypothetical protein